MQSTDTPEHKPTLEASVLFGECRYPAFLLAIGSGSCGRNTAVFRPE